jgi:hypothetical protein
MTDNDSQKISLNMTLERALYDLADEINRDIGIPDIHKKKPIGEKNNLCACSIFLYDSKRDGFILRASTLGSPYLGTAQIDLGHSKREKFDKNETNVGLTATAIWKCQSILCVDLEKDDRFSGYDKTTEENQTYRRSHYCEYPNDTISSIIIVPIYFGVGSLPSGVLRIVRTNRCEIKFTEKDLANIEEKIDRKIKDINSKIFLSQLIELGSYMEITDLCERAVKALRDILGAKGCSVFILDDDDFDISEDSDFDIQEGQTINLLNKDLTYKCYGTTGLARGTQNTKYVNIDSPISDESSWYTLKKEEKAPQTGSNIPEMSITMGVVRARTCAFIDNLHESDKKKYNTAISELFPDGFKIKRKEGRGKVSEKFEDESGQYLGTGNILYAPMFYGAPNDKFNNVLGVVRIQKPQGADNLFSKEDRHLFVSLVEHLSKAINFARLVEFLDNVSKIKNSKFLYTYIIRNIPKFINLSDCALLVADPNDKHIFSVQAEWKEGKITYKPDIPKYNIKNPSERGFSGWVAWERRILRFNSPDELTQIMKEYNFSSKRYAKHRTHSSKDPFRFLGVPIPEPSADEKAFAVIRICSSEDASKLTKQAELELSLIARRVRPYIEKSIEEEKNRLQRESLIQSIFSKSLQEKIGNLENVSKPCREKLVKFFENINSQKSIDKEVLKFLPELWHLYSKKNMQLKYIENFDFFNSNILTEIPFYRDHFVHQFVVYLMGLIIVDAFYEDFSGFYKKAYCDDREIVYGFYLEQSWLVTALFHDTAYPFEKLNSWLKQFLNKIIRDDEGGGNINIPIDSILFRPQYINRIDDLADYLNKTSINPDKDFKKIREQLLLELSDNRKTSNTRNDNGIDHGIIGALILLGDIGFSDNVIRPSATAIALHNKFLFKMNGYIVDVEKNPLGFLLIYCDLLHEWGRTYFFSGNRTYTIEEDAPSLAEINIDISKKEILFSIEIDDDKAVKEKIKEIDRVFNHIRSNDFNFMLKLNERDDKWETKKSSVL